MKLWYLLLIIPLIATVVWAWPKSPGSAGIAEKSTDAALQRLYDEADADLAANRLQAALGKFGQVVAIRPSYNDAKAKLNEAREKLVDKAKADLRAGRVDEARREVDTVLKSDPKNKEAKDILKQLPEDTAANGGGNVGAGDGLKPLNEGDTPISLLPDTLPDYNIIQSGWLNEPVDARATLVPKGAEVAKNIDRVFLKVAKFKSEIGAKQQLEREALMYPNELVTVNVNNHDAQFGLYNEGRPDMFVTEAALYWTRGNWFFTIQVSPRRDQAENTQPSLEYKKGIAIDIANKFGY